MERKHRRSLRLRDYEYSQGGAYFITICTNNREPIFEIFPKLKETLQMQWGKLEARFPDIKLDEFIIMSNHIHGIIFIVGAIHESPLPLQAIYELPLLQNRRRMLLPKVIGYFKMNTAKQFNQILNRTGQPFWQRNYYDHIIRNENELTQIREYVQNNPLKWDLDRENPKSRNFNLNHDTYWKEVYE
ncbi:MAG: transposase [Deltaproteobacteria bacterium]|nr:transposase [Deltaproteobacteria bacterium]